MYISLFKFLLEWDLIMKRMQELNIKEEGTEIIKKAILHKEGEQMRLKYSNCFLFIIQIFIILSE